MSTELIDYKNKGFQISDIYMQLALYYINEELKKNQYIFTNKGYLQRYHESIINGNMAGWFAFLWDEKLSNSLDEQTMLQVLENVKITLQNKGSFISVAELQTIPTEDKDFKRFYGRYPFPISELIKIIDALIQMLQGTWESTNYNMDINY
ncbi:hypothetical protein [Empedobacter falsenii]|uniref:hypothetical protein n=1 Tax=Empedobacter falsenii TaxID=343874 RepID=UPI00056F75CC|nr:hypothetical protein [Empedobacter falsenii]